MKWISYIGITIILLVLPTGSVNARTPIGLVNKIEARFKLPPGLLRAVVYIESRGNQWAVGWNKKSCDIGLAQVNVRGCSTLTAAFLFIPRVNLIAAARILVLSAKTCSKQPTRIGCSRCKWGRYNPRSRTWCGDLERVWKKYKEKSNGMARIPTTITGSILHATSYARRSTPTCRVVRPGA